MFRRLAHLMTTAALGAALVSVPALPASAAISCTGEDVGGDATPWYDARFGPSHQLSQATLDRYVPQGLTTWSGYFGAGHDLLLMSAYNGAGDDRRAVLQGIDQRDGSLTHRVVINTGHAGGVAVHGGFVYVSGKNGDVVRKYDAGAVAQRLRTGQGGALDGTVAGTVYASSFLAVHDGQLFAGKFDDGGRDKMGRYPIRADGNLGARVGSWIPVPTKTQGVAVTDSHFVYSTSYGRTKRSNLYVVGRGYSDLDVADQRGDLKCFRAPTMSEGVTFSRGKFYVLYESGAAKFASDPPDRVIKRLHVTDRSQLPLNP